MTSTKPIVALVAAFLLSSLASADPALAITVSELSASQPIPFCIDTKGGLYGVQDVSNASDLMYAASEGATWSKLHSFPPENGSAVTIKNIWVSPRTGTVFAGIDNNLHYQIRRSSDKGATWTTVSDFPTKSTAFGKDALTFDNAGYLYLAQYHAAVTTQQNESVYKSIDDGKTFNPVLTLTSPDDLASFQQIFVDPYHPTYIYVTAGNTDTQAAIYVSGNRGGTWSTFSSGHLARAGAIGFTPTQIVWSSEQNLFDRKWVFYDRQLRAANYFERAEDIVLTMLQYKSGLIGIGRSTDLGSPCNVYTLWGAATGPDDALLPLLNQWKRALSWYPDPLLRSFGEFRSSNVGPKGEFYLFGNQLEKTSYSNPRLLKVQPFESATTDAVFKTLPMLRPKHASTDN